MKSKKLPSLDGLRGIAAYWVLIGHVYQRILGSQLGNQLAVDLFIILSGAVMAIGHGSDTKKDILGFYLKRFFRISPLYYSLLIIWFLLPDLVGHFYYLDWKNNGFARWTLDRSVLSALLHFTYTFGFTNYYSESTPYPDWSLALEMQYYALFPALIWVLKNIKFELAILTVLLIQIILYILFRSYLSAGLPSFLLFKLHLFLAGMILGYASINSRIIQDRHYWVWSAVAIAISCLPISFHGTRYLVGRAILVLLLACVINGDQRLIFNKARQFLSLSVMRWAGNVSFSVYLLHVPITFITLYLLRQWAIQRNASLFGVTIFTVTIVTYATATLSFKFIERPGVRLGRRFADALKRDAGQKFASSPSSYT